MNKRILSRLPWGLKSRNLANVATKKGNMSINDIRCKWENDKPQVLFTLEFIFIPVLPHTCMSMHVLPGNKNSSPNGLTAAHWCITSGNRDWQSAWKESTKTHGKKMCDTKVRVYIYICINIYIYIFFMFISIDPYPYITPVATRWNQSGTFCPRC